MCVNYLFKTYLKCIVCTNFYNVNIQKVKSVIFIDLSEFVFVMCFCSTEVVRYFLYVSPGIN